MNTVKIPPSIAVQSLTITVIVLFYACGSPESEKQINNPFEGVPEIEPQMIAEITGESDSGGTADFVFGSDFFEEITFDSSG